MLTLPQSKWTQRGYLFSFCQILGFSTFFSLLHAPSVFSQDLSNAIYKDSRASIEDRVADLLPRLTLREKIGQMIMDAESSFYVGQRASDIGFYLFAPNEAPQPNTPATWRQHINDLQTASANHRLGIPTLVGVDAVHGNDPVAGATVVPHNIGLGATRNPQLINAIARMTAAEMQVTGFDQTFAPAFSVVRTMSWGRTYESYGQEADLVKSYARPFVTGLQGNSTPWPIIGTAKHWIGDGGTQNGINQGNTVVSSTEELLALYGTPYIEAIAADVGSVMISFNSVNDVRMHMNTDLITNVLKGQLGFQGYTVSDWLGYNLNPGTLEEQIVLTINAGLDVLMCPNEAIAVIDAITNAVSSGLISQSRIDDAVTRVLRTKFKAGLFEKKQQPLSLSDYPLNLGTPAHRYIARQAVRESLVLLKNDNNLLPINKEARIVLAGKNADNIRNQCGAWTMSWQGTLTEEQYNIINGTTIYQGFQKLSTGSVTLSADGSGLNPSNHDVAIVVLGETPYAETMGDNDKLVLDDEDQAVIATVRASGVPLVLVLVSGRPLLITDVIEDFSAVVAAWLPGTEGDGVAQVLYGDYDFQGKLSVSWPAYINQVFDYFIGENSDVLAPYGYGLTYSDSNTGTSQAHSTVQTPSGNSNGVPATTSQNSSILFLRPENLNLIKVDSSSVSFSWDASSNSSSDTVYAIYDFGTRIGSSHSTYFTASNLLSGSTHEFSVTTIDDSSNESSPSSVLTVSTNILVDDFLDGDDVALNGWGTWKTAFGGANGDGSAMLDVQAVGVDGYGAQLKYTVDSGVSGYSNLYLDMASGALLASNVIGISFDVSGSQNDSLKFHLGSTTGTTSPNFVTIIDFTPAWTTISLLFSAQAPYTVDDALSAASSLVWEMTTASSTGWFIIDNVELITASSTTPNHRWLSHIVQKNQPTLSSAVSSGSLNLLVALAAILVGAKSIF